jgi:hypothetical protein
LLEWSAWFQGTSLYMFVMFGCPPSLLAHVRDRLNSVPAVRWVMMKTGLDFLFSRCNVRYRHL